MMLTFKKLYDIFLQQGLSLQEAIVASMVYSFEESGMECKMSNEYISKQLNVSVRTAQNIVNKLEDKGYIISTRSGYSRVMRINKNVFCKKSDIFSRDDTY